MKIINDNIFYAIALQCVKGIGPVLSRQLIENIGPPELILKEKRESLSKLPRVGSRIGSVDDALRQAETECNFMIKHDITGLYINDKEYPARLAECVDAPIMLYKKGDADLNGAKILSIVGTRRSTAYGEEVCENLIRDIKESVPEIIIVSGLAYGIDVCAHRASIKNGISTVGVLAHGLDRIYPDRHRDIADKMANSGALISEYTSGTSPEKGNFLARNRIIAGIADATLVAESSEKGGAMVTANIVSGYGRDLFAFPGKISDVRSRGCNNLIRDNKAALITCADDLLNMMNWVKTKKQEQPQQLSFDFEFTDKELGVYNLLVQKGELHINQISAETGISIANLSTILMDMEFKEMVKSLPGAMYRLSCR